MGNDDEVITLRPELWAVGLPEPVEGSQGQAQAASGGAGEDYHEVMPWVSAAAAGEGVLTVGTHCNVVGRGRERIQFVKKVLLHEIF